MNERLVNLLLVEDNKAEAFLIKEYLRDSKKLKFNIIVTTTLKDAKEVLKENHVDLILLDLSLPDSQYPDTVEEIVSNFNHIPLVVLTGYDDEKWALQSIQKGAQDYIIKKDLSRTLLDKTLIYSIERHKLRLLYLDAAKTIRENELKLINLIDTLPDGMVLLNENCVVRFINKAMIDIISKKKEDVIGKFFFLKFCMFKHPYEVAEFEIELNEGEGKLFFETRSKPILWQEEQCCLVSFRDITSRVNAQNRLRMIAKVMESALEGIFITDLDFKIIEINKSFTEITDYEFNEVKDRDISFMSAGAFELDKYQYIYEHVRLIDTFAGEISHRRKSGEIYPIWLTISAIKDESGKTTNYVGIFTDITQRKILKHNLRLLAHHDALTGLANRTLLYDRLNQVIAESKRNNQSFAVLYIDLDGFKPINDKYGHDIGDRLLIELTNRLKGLIRESDTISRLGGDEFAVITRNIKSSNDASLIAQKILDTVSAPFQIEDKKCKVTASIGISLYPDNSNDAQGLLKLADEAMYKIKHDKKNGYTFYSS